MLSSAELWRKTWLIEQKCGQKKRGKALLRRADMGRSGKIASLEMQSPKFFFFGFGRDDDVVIFN